MRNKGQRLCTENIKNIFSLFAVFYIVSLLKAQKSQNETLSAGTPNLYFLQRVCVCGHLHHTILWSRPFVQPL